MNRNLIIYDYEVFKHDTLLGAIIIDDSGVRVFQTWDIDEHRQFYADNIQSIWLGHNISGYDNFILQGAVKGGNEEQLKAISDEIIQGNRKKYLNIQLYYYDLMTDFVGLKTIECAMGKNISESNVDFNLDRKLTDEEKRLTEEYNRDDLFQTLDDFGFMKGDFLLRLDVINEFNLSLDCIRITGTQLAETVLHAEYTDGIENWVVKPQMYPQLQVKNQEVLDFYMNEDFRAGKKLKVNLCGVDHNVGAGGLHGARSKYHCDWAYYFDVSGYYNLIMINYDLLPRSIPEEYRAFYKEMYETQLELKKHPELIQKRWAYKTILLSVFGAMTNQWCKFYDPYRGTLVTMVGQMFLIDLLEKLEGKVELVQSNTDGIIAKPAEGVDKQIIIDIIDEWQERTGFVLALETITDIHQRDVNCYMYKDDKGKIHTLGDVKHHQASENIFARQSYNSKECWIVAKCAVEYFMSKKLPEQVVEETKDDLQMFQCICKKGTFEYVEYEHIDRDTGNIIATRVQNVNRAFALKPECGRGMLYKRRKAGKTTKVKMQSIPDSVFVFNGDIHEENAIKEIQSKIDYQYYINRAYEVIQQFVDVPKVKEIKA